MQSKMLQAMPKYINPYTDFGFKKLFGEYEESRMNYLGIKAVSDTAKEEGREEERAKAEAEKEQLCREAAAKEEQMILNMLQF